MRLVTKFISLGAVLVLVVFTNIYINIQNASLASQQELLVQVMQRHMEADMMHDGIRGNVYSALVALKTGDATLLKDSVNEAEEMSKNFTALAEQNSQVEIPPAIQQQFASIVKAVATYQQTAQQIVSLSDFDQAVAALPKFNDVFSVLEKEQADATDMLLALSAEVHTGYLSYSRYSQIALAILLVIGIGLPVFSVLAIFRPQLKMSHALSSLAEGHPDINIPYTQVNNEIGDLARTAEVFKNNLLEVQALQQQKAHQKAEAEQERKAAMNQLANQFESTIRRIIDSVAAASTELAQTAEALTGAMQETRQTTESVVFGANQASNSVQSVAEAAEEMSLSVREISGQLQHSHALVQDSVARAEAADHQAESLEAATTRVRDVIALISSISGQINLLALNATIESARAGDAGKGFAVVAGEVKTLANQTNRSVEEIGSVIGEMKIVSDQIISSLTGIKESVDNISGVSNAISAAVEEQSATTSEISRNMKSAAMGTEGIADNLEIVSEAVVHAEEAATQVLEASRDLSQQSEYLEMEVERFLHVIRGDQ